MEGSVFDEMFTYIGIGEVIDTEKMGIDECSQVLFQKCIGHKKCQASPNIDEQAIFFYPDFAQYASEKITYGTNTDKIETLLEYTEQFQPGIYDHAQTARYSAWVFDAERLILKFGGRLRFDHSALGWKEIKGHEAVKYLKQLKAFFLKHPENKVSTVCEILVTDRIRSRHR